MNQKARRWVMLSFLLFFLIVSPILILYSLGFKYNWQKNRLEKTGVFFIKSFPKNSEVYLDGQPIGKKTPTQITRLLAKNYQLEIKKEGYRPWSKNLEILPQITTFIEDVSLFKEELNPEILMAGTFAGLLPSPNRQMIALIEETDQEKVLWIYNLLSDDFTKVYAAGLPSKLEIVSWSYTNRKLIIRDNDSFVIINAIQPDYYLKLSEITNLQVSQVKWHQLNDNLLIAESNKRLYEIDIISKDIRLLTDELVLTFEPFKNDLIYISQEGNSYFLKKLSNFSSQETLFSLPGSADYQFGKADDFLILADASQKVIYLLKPSESQPIKDIIKNVADYNWHNQRLLYWNNSELWSYDPESKEENLLERTSQKVAYGFWHPNSTHVFGVIANKLKIYELDGRDQRNIYELLELESDQEQSVLTDSKGNYLYLAADYNGESGFYKIEIQ